MRRRVSACITIVYAVDYCLAGFTLLFLVSSPWILHFGSFRGTKGASSSRFVLLEGLVDNLHSLQFFFTCEIRKFLVNSQEAWKYQRHQAERRVDRTLTSCPRGRGCLGPGVGLEPCRGRHRRGRRGEGLRGCCRPWGPSSGQTGTQSEGQMNQSSSRPAQQTSGGPDPRSAFAR